MNYPLISEYIEAIKSAEDNFEELSFLRPVLGDGGLPVMTSGNFAVVFKMKDEQSGKFYAVKCFTKEQKGRTEAYREIAKELENVSSPYILSIRYLDKELFVDTDQTIDTEFPVLLMDWVEGKTLDIYLRENLDDKYALELLAYRFSQLARWLIPQPFAHGDLKPDNILVREDGTLVLVDYDGMYVPAMKGQKARELGSPDFRLPFTEVVFDEHIDDFALTTILLSLKAISLQPSLLELYGAPDRLLFSQNDYRDISNCELLKYLFPSKDSELNRLISTFTLALEEKNLSNVSFYLFNLCKPREPKMKYEDFEACCAVDNEGQLAPYVETPSWPFLEFAKDYEAIELNYADQAIYEDVYEACYFEKTDGTLTIVYNEAKFTLYDIYGHEDELKVELRKSGHLVLCKYSSDEPQALSDSINAVKARIKMLMKETYLYFQGKDTVLHIIRYGTESWITENHSSFVYEAEKKDASEINIVENERMHVLLFYNSENVEVGRYNLSKKLQGLTPNQILAQKSELVVFEKWNSFTKQWESCVGLLCDYSSITSIKKYTNIIKIYDEACSMIREKRYKNAYIVFRQLSLNPYGQNGLGVCYAYGYFVEKDMEKAAYWFLKAARIGLDIAQFNIGNCYYNGIGILKARNLAFRWYELACEQGLDIANEMYYDVTYHPLFKGIDDKRNFERRKEVSNLFILYPLKYSGVYKRI